MHPNEPCIIHQEAHAFLVSASDTRPRPSDAITHLIGWVLCNFLESGVEFTLKRNCVKSQYSGSSVEELITGYAKNVQLSSATVLMQMPEF